MEGTQQENSLQQHWVKRAPFPEHHNGYRQGPAAFIVSPFLPQNVTFLQQAGCRIAMHSSGNCPKSAFLSLQNTKAPALQQEPIAWSIPQCHLEGHPVLPSCPWRRQKGWVQAGAPSTPAISTSPPCTTHCSHLCRILAKIKVWLLLILAGNECTSSSTKIKRMTAFLSHKG